ncbi:MAG: EAL domain-containing protein, partial [Thermoanaerobaculia bacterium]
TLALARALPQPPSHIVFELIETEGVARSPTLAALLTEVRAEGFRIALDDLESGFSTLGVLERLRPDIAKLDQHLVRGAYADPYRARLVKSFVSLTRDLGIQLIVEGVETREDYGFVCDLGIRLAQGYYFGRPSLEPVRTFPFLRGNTW